MRMSSSGKKDVTGMILATVWYWYLLPPAVIAVAMIGRGTLRATFRKLISVKDDDNRPLSLRQRVLLRYQNHAFSPFVFAWCKTRQDPMFEEFPELLEPIGRIKTFLDLGCGFGFAGSYLLEMFPGSQVYAVEPSQHRVTVAKLAIGDRGHVFQGAAPDFENPSLPEHFDAIFTIDMLHYLDDSALNVTLLRLRARLDDGHYLIIRAPMQPEGFGSLIWNLTRIHTTVWGMSRYYRTVEQLRLDIERAGFDVVRCHISGKNPEIHWFISRAVPLEENVERLVLEPVPAVGDDREQHHA
jgi:SAM-dependent methyltransferase